MQLEKKAVLVGEFKMTQKTQTDVTGKQIESQHISKPFKFQSIQMPRLEQESQTDVNFAVYDYMLQASKTQELILASG